MNKCKNVKPCSNPAHHTKFRPPLPRLFRPDFHGFSVYSGFPSLQRVTFRGVRFGEIFDMAAGKIRGAGDQHRCSKTPVFHKKRICGVRGGIGTKSSSGHKPFTTTSRRFPLPSSAPSPFFALLPHSGSDGLRRGVAQRAVAPFVQRLSAKDASLRRQRWADKGSFG